MWQWTNMTIKAFHFSLAWLVGWLVKGQRGENPGWMQICSQNVYRPQSLCCLWTFSISCPLSVRSEYNNPSAAQLKHNRPEPVASYIMQGLVSHYHHHHHQLSHYGDHLCCWSGDLLPVMVFIHGESYNWGSGNLFDGRVLIIIIIVDDHHHLHLWWWSSSSMPINQHCFGDEYLITVLHMGHPGLGVNDISEYYYCRPINQHF